MRACVAVPAQMGAAARFGCGACLNSVFGLIGARN